MKGLKKGYRVCVALAVGVVGWVWGVVARRHGDKYKISDKEQILG